MVDLLLMTMLPIVIYMVCIIGYVSYKETQNENKKIPFK